MIASSTIRDFKIQLFHINTAVLKSDKNHIENCIKKFVSNAQSSKTNENLIHDIDHQSKSLKNSVNNDQLTLADQNSVIKSWTCSWCKNVFTQRTLLNKHECIETHLKFLKKKKEMRKKKWSRTHLKRRIDLSYIQTSSLTQCSQNIADNLSFCIDGTHEDLKAFAREIKYLL